MSNEQDIYEEHVLDHYEDPYHRGVLDSATHHNEGKNPLCGDIVQVSLRLNADGKIEEAWFEGDGCVISLASASMLIESIEGMTVEEAKEFSANQMLELFGPKLTHESPKVLSVALACLAVRSPLSH